MEQSVRSDSGRMPAAQVDSRSPEQEARVAALLTGPQEPTPPFSAAAEVSLAHRVLDYFGDGPIDPILNCDIALRDQARAILAGAAMPDPIFAVIEENRGLHAEWSRVGIRLAPGTVNPAPEATAASDAFHDHAETVLLTTVPRTAAGCAALAAYCVESFDREGWVLDQADEDRDFSEHLRVLDLIARSPAAMAQPASGLDRDANLLALGRQFEAAIAQDKEACARLNAAGKAAGSRKPVGAACLTFRDTEAVADETAAAADMLAYRIAEMPAHTAAGLRLKVRALAHCKPAAFRLPPEQPDPEQVLAWSLYQDACRPEAVGSAAVSDSGPAASTASPLQFGPDAAIADLAMGFCRAYAINTEADRALMDGSGTEEAFAQAYATTLALMKRLAKAEPQTVLGWGLKSLGAMGELAWEAGEDCDGANRWDQCAAQFLEAMAAGRIVPSASALGTVGEAKPSAPDLSALSVQQLTALYHCFVEAADLWLEAMEEPWANDPSGLPFRAPNAVGEIVEAEQSRVAHLRDAVAAELGRRAPPANPCEQDAWLETLIHYEILCNGSLRHAPELRAAITETWGAQA